MKRELRQAIKQAAALANQQVTFAMRRVAIFEDGAVVADQREARDVMREVGEVLDRQCMANPLRRYLKKWGLEYDDVAAELGIQRPLLSQYAHDHVSPSAARRRMFARWSHGEIPEDGWPLPVREAHRPRKDAA